MSIYREEAIDALISCLRNTNFPAAQLVAAETILSLQGRFNFIGKPFTREVLLKRAGLNRAQTDNISYFVGEFETTPVWFFETVYSEVLSF